MTFRQQLVIGGFGAALIVFMAPFAWSAFGAHGYFYQGRCACGNDVFVRIQGDSYLKYSPGHGVPEHRAFALRAGPDGWDVMGLPQSDRYWSPLEGKDKVMAHLWLRDGALYESWGSSTNGVRLPRVYNIWKVWFAKLLRQ